MPLILEGLVTTLDPDGQVNLAPMGPIVDRAVTHLTLRPFVSSRTYANLRRAGCGVFHVTDDVELLVRAAIHELADSPVYQSLDSFPGQVLVSACRWFAFQVVQCDDREPRAEMECSVVERGTLRDFLGFNRAQHAVLEAAILATRVDLLEHDFLARELERLEILVAKTAGDREESAWRLVAQHIRRRIAAPHLG